MNQKTFYRIIIDFNVNPHKAKFYLEDKRLTFNEKKILDAYYLIRNNENVEAMKLMKGLAPSPLPFVEAQRKLLIGVALNNQSLFNEAEESILNALSVFKELDTQFSIFMCYFNLSFVYYNQLQMDKMKTAIDEMGHLSFETDFQRAKHLRAQFAYFAHMVEVNKAHRILEEIKPWKAKMPESDNIAQLVIEFIFYSGQEDFKQCQMILDEMKNFRKFHLSENFNFMKKLLDHLVHNEPIYFTEGKSHDVPILNYQLRVIQALEEMDLVKAKTNWTLLSSMMPDLYHEDFIFKGPKGLFSLCLDKHLSKISNAKPIQKNQEMSLLNSLYHLLKSSTTPLSKAYIYEYLWNTPPQDKSDMSKLEKLISKIRTEKGFDVISRKGTYQVAPRPNKKHIA